MGLGTWLAVLGFLIVQSITLAVLPFVASPGGAMGLRSIGQGLTLIAVTLALVTYLTSALHQGRPSFRWVGFGYLLLFGVFLIGMAYWQTTWDFPNASSPEERSKMQEHMRRDWPWQTAWGALNVVVGGLLLLPPVGQFLGARRERTNRGPFKINPA